MTAELEQRRASWEHRLRCFNSRRKQAFAQHPPVRRDPVLARHAADAFPDETLEIELGPPEVAAVAEIVVLDGTGVPVASRAGFTEPLARFSLPPQMYAVRGTAPGFERAALRAPVDLYRPVRVALMFRPLPAAASTRH